MAFRPIDAIRALGRPAIASAVLAVATGCGGGEEAQAGPSPALAIGQKAPWPTGDWTVVSPEQMGMDSNVLAEARDYALRPDQNTQGVVVVRGGAIVAEWYREGYDATSFAASWSMAKSFVSATLGIAIQEGLVGGTDDTLGEYYPEWAGTQKGAIPLRSVLQMQSGLDFVEDYADAQNSDVIRIGATADTLGYMLANVDVKVPYDSQWYYSSGDTQLLSGIVERTSKMSTRDYARERVFEPIGMNSADWWVDGTGQTIGFCCLDAPVRQFAKFGLLFLRNGEWDGRQVVPASWVRESTTARASQYGGYAYQWWLVQPDTPLPQDLYLASGKDGQSIYVIPSLDLVVAKNTIYRKPPGEAVAENGYIAEFTPGGLTPYGTLAAGLWEDGPFLASIIRSIRGAKQDPIAATPPPGSSPNDPVLCKARAMSGFAGYCEEMHGCVCDGCAGEFLDCNGNAACRAIMQCALDKGCRGIECAGPCQGVIEQNGGVQGAGVAFALKLSECSTSCPVSCP
jgi:CubicO group peptidase (beta-lactamase class C family)